MNNSLKIQVGVKFHNPKRDLLNKIDFMKMSKSSEKIIEN